MRSATSPSVCSSCSSWTVAKAFSSIPKSCWSAESMSCLAVARWADWLMSPLSVALAWQASSKMSPISCSTTLHRTMCAFRHVPDHAVQSWKVQPPLPNNLTKRNALFPSLQWAHVSHTSPTRTAGPPKVSYMGSGGRLGWCTGLCCGLGIHVRRRCPWLTNAIYPWIHRQPRGCLLLRTRTLLSHARHG